MSERVPPHRLDAERAVLGSVLIRPSVLDELDLHEDEFFTPAHRAIWRAMREVALRSKGKVDVVLVADQVRRAGDANALEGAPERYLMGLLDIPTAEGAGHWSRLVRRAATLRRVIELGATMQARAYGDGEPEALLADLRRDAAALEQVDTPDDVRVGDRLHDVLDGISQRAGGMRGEFAIPTGIAAYDEKVAHAGGKLIVVAGPPSHGKTALGGGWAAAAAIDGYPTLVFSLEMTAEELIHRFLARESGVAASDMATGAVSYADFKGPIYAAAEKLRAPELYVVTEDDTFARVRARIRRWYARRVSPTARKLGLVVVDYLQLVAGEEGSKTREREIGQMSRGFKRLAVELNVPIVLLSQLSRAYAQRDESEPPKLSDLRDSGQIEQDADIVVFPWRRPYEGDDGSKLWNDDCPADLIVAKNRGGRRGKVPAKWHAKATTFRDMERADREPVRNWQDGREED